MTETPFVVVAVGTDHHPFDRVVGWVDRWLADRADPVSVLVQYGTSVSPEVAEGRPLLSSEDLQQAMAEATAVVTHGGPATITEARRHGRRPICVPRDPALGEHVDDHQQRFARRMAAAGIVELAESESDFRTALDRALDDPASTSLSEVVGAGHLPGVLEVGRRISELVGAHPSEGEEEEATRPQVLYVAGLGRSGSTLLEGLIGQLPGVVDVGETVHLWQRSLVDNELCGCGQPFDGCPFWQQVGEVAYGGWDRLDADEVLALKASVDRTRYTPALLVGATSGFRERLATYNGLLTELYRGVLQVSDARVVLDGSKHGSLLHVLRHNPDLDLKVLHVVRDSPAVAYSWTRKIRRPESTGNLDYMHSWSPTHTARQWVAENTLVELARARGVTVLRIRYEDFVESPEATLRLVKQLIGIPCDQGEHLLDGKTMRLHPSHTVSGNPLRFNDGTVAIAEDVRWRMALPTKDRVVVKAITSPLRWRYGYAREHKR